MSAPNAARAAELARRTPRSSASTISGSGSRSTTVPSARRSCSINADRAAARRASRSRSRAETAASPAAPATRRGMGSSARDPAHAVRQQVEIARPAQRQHQRRKQRRADRQQRGADRRPPTAASSTRASDRDSGDHRRGRPAPAWLLAGVSMRWWRARTPRSIAAAISGSSCSSLAHEIQHLQCPLLRHLARRDHLAGQRIGGLAQPRFAARRASAARHAAARPPRSAACTAASVTVPSCSVVKSWNTGSVCTWPAITPISRSVMPPSAAATRTMVRTSASGASRASRARIAKLRVA